MKKINMLIALLLLFWSCNQGNEKAESQCKCPIAENVDIKSEKGKKSSDQAWGVGAGGDVGSAIRKAVDAKISISGSYSNSNSKIEEVYREIIGSNPKITQKANLYRSVACAYYEIACQDKSLNDKEKSNKLNEVVAGYEKNINKIVNEEASIKADIRPNPTPKSSPKSTIPQEVPTPNSNDTESGNSKAASQGDRRIEDSKSNGNKPTNPSTSSQKFTRGYLTFELISCTQSGETVECTIKIVSKDKDVDIYMVREDVRIVIQNGNEFEAGQIRLGDKTSWGNAWTHVAKNLVSGVPINCVLVFNGVQEEVKEIPKFETHFSTPDLERFQLVFRNVKL